MRKTAWYLILFLSFSLCQVFAENNNELEQKAAVLNEEGIKQLKENDFTAAINYISQALDVLPGNEILKTNLATAYNNYAISLNKRGQFEDAKDNLYKALELNPNNKNLKSNLANIVSSVAGNYYKNANYELAELELKHSLAFLPEHVPSLILLGQIYYQEQKMNEAEEIWARALKYDPNNAELKDMLNRLKKEKKIESGLAQTEAFNFDIRFDKEAVDSDIYDIRDYLKQTFKDVGRDFNFFPENTVTVILYTEDDFQKLRQTPEWISGIYDGKIRIPYRNGKISEEELQCLIQHEYTHAIIYMLTAGNCPLWFNEGIAKYEESKIRKPNLAYLQNALKKKSLIPLNNLDPSFKMSNNPEKMALAYLEAYTFVDFIMEYWNLYTLRQILEYLKKGYSLDKAFIETVRRTPESLQEKWIEHINSLA